MQRNKQIRLFYTTGQHGCLISCWLIQNYFT